MSLKRQIPGEDQTFNAYRLLRLEEGGGRGFTAPDFWGGTIRMPLLG